ncbi:hypothetical protein L4C34_05260 [Vibrio profundum]|uniref:hypothetical protein n=1 Tax=Vibrio profundum TaxID=2910247 RepID=UPI003D151653
MKKHFLFSIVLLSSSYACAEPKIEAYKAPFYVNQLVVACGDIAQISDEDEIDYLNLDLPYPNQTLSIAVDSDVIFGLESQFGDIKSWNGKQVCVRGKVVESLSRLQINVSDPVCLRLMG